MKTPPKSPVQSFKAPLMVATGLIALFLVIDPLLSASMAPFKIALEILCYGSGVWLLLAWVCSSIKMLKTREE